MPEGQNNKNRGDRSDNADSKPAGISRHPGNGGDSGGGSDLTQIAAALYDCHVGPGLAYPAAASSTRQS